METISADVTVVITSSILLKTFKSTDSDWIGEFVLIAINLLLLHAIGIDFDIVAVELLFLSRRLFLAIASLLCRGLVVGIRVGGRALTTGRLGRSLAVSFAGRFAALLRGCGAGGGTGGTGGAGNELLLDWAPDRRGGVRILEASDLGELDIVDLE